MKRCKTVLTLFITAAFIMTVFGGCGKTTTAAPDSSSGSLSSANATSSPSKSPSPSPSPSPTPTVNPQADFIDGAKAFLSTDLVNLFTGEENGTRFIGMLSDFLNDLNTKTTQTEAKITLSDLVLGKDKSDTTVLLDLNALHDSKSGDTAVTLGLGTGSDVAVNIGVYLNGGAAVLKPSSADEKIMLYTMPSVPGAGNTFADKGLSFLTGLFSNDGKAFTLGSNMKDRQALTARFLDPWTKDTSQTDYADKQITMNLLGKDVPLRSVTLNLTGKKAYDFVLKNMSALQADTQFAQTDRLLGGLTGFLSTDMSKLLTGLISKSTKPAAPAASAVGDLVTELKALTPDEITAAKFIVSLIFDGKKVIGINIEASTTGKAFLLDGLIYRKGLEHELELKYQSIKGESASITLSTVSTGGDNYDISGKIEAKNAAGLETYAGGYSGKLTETNAKYDLTGNINITIGYADKKGAPSTGTIGGDLTLSITHDTAGYKATGAMDFSVKAESSLSAKAQLDIGMTSPAAVTITPPKYTSANVTTVTNKSDLWAIHAASLGKMENYSSAAQDFRLLLAFLGV